MKRPEEVKREFVGQWLRKGAGDLKIARYLLGGSPDLSYGAAFHAQQAAKKPLKAVLVWHQVEFAKTHDIGRILDLVRTADPRLADRVRQTDKVALPELRFAPGEPELDTTSIDNAAFALEDRSYFVRKVGSDGFRIGY